MRRVSALQPSPATVIALIALVVALGGTGYAALKLPAASVGTKQLKKKAVTTSKLADKAVNGAKVLDNSLTGADINIGTLGKVPSATAADTAGSATNANHASTADSATTAATAAALGSVTYAVDTSAGPVTVPKCDSSPCTPEQVGTAFAIAVCPVGMVVIGGGGVTAEPGVELGGSFPTTFAGRAAWEVDVDNYLQTPSSVHYYAICTAANSFDTTNVARSAHRHAR